MTQHDQTESKEPFPQPTEYFHVKLFLDVWPGDTNSSYTSPKCGHSLDLQSLLFRSRWSLWCQRTNSSECHFYHCWLYHFVWLLCRFIASSTRLNHKHNKRMYRQRMRELPTVVSGQLKLVKSHYPLHLRPRSNTNKLTFVIGVLPECIISQGEATKKPV